VSAPEGPPAGASVAGVRLGASTERDAEHALDPAAAAAPSRLAAEIFGADLDKAVRYVRMLATAGVERGLIGPREADRLWDRHMLNCAVLAEILPAGATVVDVGSGAGLPGVPLALARPDLRITFLEPMERRCVFLAEVVAALGAESRLTVLRGRAPDAARGPGGLSCDVAVARAVAPLERLGAMLLPVVRPGGVMLAMRGSRVDEELAEAHGGLRSQGWEDVRVVLCGVGRLAEPTRVLTAVRARDLGPGSGAGGAGGEGAAGRAGGSGRRGGGKRHDDGQRGRTAREARQGRETGRDRPARGTRPETGST
jgi:16S rRNA (guanine527-N7)-methyltransferase